MYKKYIKRFIDILLALIGLPFFILIFILLAPIIYFEDKGSVFYYSDRLGRNGKTFKMYKFRSMKMNAPDLRNADGSTYNAEDDPRVTKIGALIRKTSLDEVPQFINVISGDMSFVGPRPDLPTALQDYSSEQKTRLEVRPGITGYSQAYYRNSVDCYSKWQNDFYYVKNMSLWFDTKILTKTVLLVLKREKVFIEHADGIKNTCSQ